jgi:arylsulfatase A-like enzyme
VESERMILNVDLAPTLLDLAELEVPAYMQGESILPLLTDPESAWRDAFYYSYYREAPFPAPTAHAIRTERYKYIEYEAKEAELFDLERDPEERNDLLGTEEGERLGVSLSRGLQALRSSAGLETIPREEGASLE